MAKRSSKRQRREPVRRPIPAAKLTAPPARQTHSAAGDPLLPAFEASGLLGALLDGRIEAVPLYAVVAAVHQALSGQILNACLPVCYQLSGALRLLGFQAEPMAAHVQLYQGKRRYKDIGVEGPATVRPDWTTNGHMIVWADSFGRLVDPTVGQHPELHRAAHHDHQRFGAPLVLPLGSREQLFGGPLGARRDPYMLGYTVQPQYTDVFTGWHHTFAEALDYGAIVLAHAAADLLDATGKHRNLRQLPHLYPQLGPVLAGRTGLPAVPDTPPAAVARLQQVGGGTFLKLTPTDNPTGSTLGQTPVTDTGH